MDVDDDSLLLALFSILHQSLCIIMHVAVLRSLGEIMINFFTTTVLCNNKWTVVLIVNNPR